MIDIDEHIHDVDDDYKGDNVWNIPGDNEELTRTCETKTRSVLVQIIQVPQW